MNFSLASVGFLPNEFGQIASAVSSASAGAKTDLDGGENSRFSRTVLTMNEIDYDCEGSDVESEMIVNVRKSCMQDSKSTCR